MLLPTSKTNLPVLSRPSAPTLQYLSRFDSAFPPYRWAQKTKILRFDELHLFDFISIGSLLQRTFLHSTTKAILHCYNYWLKGNGYCHNIIWTSKISYMTLTAASITQRINLTSNLLRSQSRTVKYIQHYLAIDVSWADQYISRRAPLAFEGTRSLQMFLYQCYFANFAFKTVPWLKVPVLLEKEKFHLQILLSWVPIYCWFGQEYFLT